MGAQGGGTLVPRLTPTHMGHLCTSCPLLASRFTPSWCLVLGAMADVGPQDIEVAKEDQQNINRFSRLNVRYEELDEDLDTLKKNLQAYKDAIEEAEGCMEDDGLRFRIGEAYVKMDEDSVLQKLGDYVSKAESDVSSKTDEIELVKTDMDKLKKLLYSKFGNSINLEK